MAKLLPSLSVVVWALVVLVPSSRPARAEGVRHLEGVVNINTAAPEELRLLPGVGPAKIRAILAYRRVRAFRTVDELARVKGIGPKMVRALRMHIAVSGPTTAQHVIRAEVPADAVSGPVPVAPPPPRPRPPPAPPARRPPAPPGPPAVKAPRAGIGAGFPSAAANHCAGPR
jgi:competence ComEA-like helix-hairpin-helix protein